MSEPIHPTAIVEDDVLIGDRTTVWDHVHIRQSSRIGEDCIIGEKTYIAYKVRIGSRVKINAFVYICTGVVIGDGVMISAGAIFTNDLRPRAITPDGRFLRGSDPNEETPETFVEEGATIGAGAVIGPGLTIGRFAMIGMGSVVTKPVPPFFQVVGNPARAIGCVCRCGALLIRFGESGPPDRDVLICEGCSRVYSISEGTVRESAAELEGRLADV